MFKLACHQMKVSSFFSGHSGAFLQLRQTRIGMLRGYSISACSNAPSLPAKLLSSDALLMSVVHCTSTTVLRDMWQWLLAIDCAKAMPHVCIIHPRTCSVIIYIIIGSM